MKIGITGASGLIGGALVPRLRAGGHDVIRFVRRPDSAADTRVWDAAHLEPDAVADLDAVIHLAGAGVGDHRWSERWKREVLQSRVRGTTAVATALARVGGRRVLLSASGVDYYADRGDELLDETGPTGNGFLASVCREWEAATAPAEQAGVRVVRMRTAVVLTPAGGALRAMMPIFRLGLGAPLGSGRQWFAWISLADQLGAVEHLLAADVSGPVNLVAPNPVTNRDFTKALGAALHRPTLPVPVPGFVLRAALGAFADEALLTGQRVVPAALERSGYVFRHPHLQDALRAVLEPADG